ncbi:MAG: hypothetical protein C0459_15195 [Chitinophaga sp.]|jgi:predicted nucleotide-binding protein (sugar kinase/HSP70/actin superfamily)|nr:hypothetical protein [Chitinophaga sp.]
MINYSISKIEEMVDKEEFSTEMIPVVETLLSAVNDWSNPLDNFNDYEIAVQHFIKNITTKNNIESALKNVNVSSYAWEAESLSSLIKIYDYFEEGITLKEIIDKIIQTQSPI